MSKFKAGDRVYFAGSEWENADSGLVVSCDGSIYSNDGVIWVKWDSDSKTLYINEDAIEFEKACVRPVSLPSGNDEQQAVMLLLNLGYTVSKNKQ